MKSTRSFWKTKKQNTITITKLNGNKTMIYEVKYQKSVLGMLPDENSVNLSQMHAEMDLWNTRLNMAKEAKHLASLLVSEIEKWDYGVLHYQDALDLERKWVWAVDKIQSKYEKVKTAYENYFTEMKEH